MSHCLTKDLAGHDQVVWRSMREDVIVNDLVGREAYLSRIFENRLGL
jgi:hypothetical protein